MSEKGRFELRKRARRRALQAIYQWQITRQDASEISRQFRQAQNFSEIDEAHFEDLLTGVIRELETLDSKIEPFLDRPLEQVDLMERVVIRLGTYELLFCPEMPYRVVLDESVDLAQRFGSEQGHAFVNAVLDKAAKSLRPEETGTADLSR